MQAVASIFGGAQKPDASLQAAQQKASDDAAKRQADLDAQEKARDDARQRAAGRGARAQLIGPNGELGVTEDAGAAAANGKSKLGE